MSLIYKLFGIPRTLNEFVDKVKREKLHNVNIFKYDDFAGPSYIGLKARDIKLILKERAFWWSYENLIELYRDAIDTSKRLQALGLEVKIDGKPINKTKEKIAYYGRMQKKENRLPFIVEEEEEKKEEERDVWGLKKDDPTIIFPFRFPGSPFKKY